jgi:cell fate regulator YaaT (PSP1 superfamily)
VNENSKAIEKVTYIKKNNHIGIIGISFRNSLSVRFCIISSYIPVSLLVVGQVCLINTEFGLDFGKISKPIYYISEKSLPPNVYILVKIADRQDLDKMKQIVSLESEAYKIGKEKIKELKINMHLSEVRVLFDKSKIIFYYIAEHRVDFRELVRELASTFKTRIEMRQIGVRDEVRLHGGYGVCGRPLCCSMTNYTLKSVTLQMVKDQNINFNVVKLSGLCGRLLCCVGYEHSLYLNYKKGIPEYGSEVEYNKEVGVVISVDILKRMVKVRMPNGNILELSPKDIKVRRTLLGGIKKTNVPESFVDQKLYSEENSDKEKENEVWRNKP